MKKTLFVLMVVVGLLTAILAQSRSTGVCTGILKDQDGKALSNVNIDVVQGITTVLSITTDTNGIFTLQDLAAGDYELHISQPGYQVLVHRLRLPLSKKQRVELVLTRISKAEKESAEKATAESISSLLSGGFDPNANQVQPPNYTIVTGVEGFSVAGRGSGGHKDYIASDAGGLGMLAEAGSATSSMSFNPNMRFDQNHGFPSMHHYDADDGNTEEYSALTRNIFHSPLDQPLSTFSIDVDTAFYSQLRSMLNRNQLPSPNSVRIEELINYFDYDYPEPEKGKDFSVYTELGTNPWNEQRQLLHIGIKGRELDMSKAPPSNLVFLIDVSGSMRSHNKLPLVKESMKLLAGQMRPQDQVAIAVYAGSAGLVLPSSDGNEKAKIIAALERLNAGGSTAGGEGIRLAYKTAEESFIEGGNNRVILCSDGDFNVGVSSTAELTQMIEGYRKKGVFLTILGFGMGNYKDNRMEELSNKGNGNYAYIDNLEEAKKVLVNQMAGTLYTIAKDVKFQIEFNPAHVKAYRLVGYENRMLRAEDFKDDTKDAGELGAGHTVTALYEIIPAGSEEKIAELDELKYQRTSIAKSPELATVKLRFKKPDQDVSSPMDVSVGKEAKHWEKCSNTFRWANAVAGFGMILSDGESKGELNFEMVRNMARSSLGEDTEGWRNGFVSLINQAITIRDREHTQKYQD